MNRTMPTFHFYAPVTHELGFSIPLSYRYDVKDKNMFFLCVLIITADMSVQGWNSHLGQHESWF